MNRGLWFVAGAGAGVYAMIRGRRAAESLTAEGLQDRWSALTHGARLLRDEVAQGKAEAEVDLRARLGLVPATTPELEAPSTPTINEISSTEQEGTH
ncbi:MAG TPA: DUF6167 family protein [Nocardioides sp.]|jgi:hypothetical protein|uniref:DUF6167 family protein n=1 Tax=Nocardioides sp. TaxID=35761 RepID=UPI002C438630|nr:DUF6167 family protein [Nocardioides sp.]HTW14435.1 DUF6167 family protein [Nocardioides sp.]